MTDDSILDSTKKVLGMGADYTAFDTDVTMHINMVFATLNQLGVGPTIGFAIEDATATWGDFLGTNLAFNMVKTYTYLKIKMVFDPPQTHFTIQAMRDQITELETRIQIVRESTQWVDPLPALQPMRNDPEVWYEEPYVDPYAGVQPW